MLIGLHARKFSSSLAFALCTQDFSFFLNSLSHPWFYKRLCVFVLFGTLSSSKFQSEMFKTCWVYNNWLRDSVLKLCAASLCHLIFSVCPYLNYWGCPYGLDIWAGQVGSSLWGSSVWCSFEPCVTCFVLKAVVALLGCCWFYPVGAGVIWLDIKYFFYVWESTVSTFWWWICSCLTVCFFGSNNCSGLVQSGLIWSELHVVTSQTSFNMPVFSTSSLHSCTNPGKLWLTLYVICFFPEQARNHGVA